MRAASRSRRSPPVGCPRGDGHGDRCGAPSGLDAELAGLFDEDDLRLESLLPPAGERRGLRRAGAAVGIVLALLAAWAVLGVGAKGPPATAPAAPPAAEPVPVDPGTLVNASDPPPRRHAHRRDARRGTACMSPPIGRPAPSPAGRGEARGGSPAPPPRRAGRARPRRRLPRRRPRRPPVAVVRRCPTPAGSRHCRRPRRDVASWWMRAAMPEEIELHAEAGRAAVRAHAPYSRLRSAPRSGSPAATGRCSASTWRTPHTA